MKSTTKYVGLDVSKEKIAVAIADEGRDAPRFYGVINHNPDAVRKLMRKLSEDGVHLEVCYEAGPTGYDLYRWISAMKIHCVVIAPSRTPIRSGDHVKTDRRDAERLAGLHRAGELTEIFVPSPDTEALRELVRARQTAKEDHLRNRQRMAQFLIRHHIHPPITIKRRWTKLYHKWLNTLTFESASEQIVFQEFLHAIRESSERITRLEAALVTQAHTCLQAPVIQALQSLRGVALLTAVTLVAEIGSFVRFRSPAQLMAYLGMVPREYSSGASVKRGSLTKTGNSLVRRTFVEAAWGYRHRPAIKGELEIRLHGQSADIQAISWKAQQRLHNRYLHLLRRGKHANVAIAAVGRELVGFVWAIAVHVERAQSA